MLNQGNVFMGHSLALVTTIAIKQGQTTNEKDIARAITAAVEDHIERRFNKARYARAGDDLLATSTNKQQIGEVSGWLRAIVKERVHVASIKSNESQEALRKIVSAPPGPNGQGTVYILFRSQNHADRPDYSDAKQRQRDDLCDASLVSLLGSLVSNIRVEFFTITYETHAQGQADCLYHLASRVCGAMVEYKARLYRVRDAANTTNSEPPLKALPLMDNKGQISGVVTPSQVVRKIFDLRDAVDLVCEGLDGSMNFFPPVPRGMQEIFQGEDNKTKVVATRYKFPFGVWFRGQSRACHALIPSLYHERRWDPVHPGCRKLKCDGTMYDESTLVHHFMAHKATLRRDYNDIFEWLCLMQHYDAPSRVLDWTENILTALYFAVADTTADCDGAVWALNAGRLNEITRVSSSKRYVCLANSTDVILRSAMAVSRTGMELRRTLFRMGKLEEVEAAVADEAFWKWTKGKRRGETSETWQKLACPVAVFPTRINERESTQLATFTIYGGKDYDREVEKIQTWERFASPRGLLWVSQHLQLRDDKTYNKSLDINKKEWTPRGKRFLDVYVVPSCAKRKLREQLKRVGVHVGSLFPELEYQAKYIRHQWRFEYESPDKNDA